MPAAEWTGIVIVKDIVIEFDGGAPKLIEKIILQELRPTVLTTRLTVFKLCGKDVKGNLAAVSSCVCLRTLVLNDTKVGDAFLAIETLFFNHF